MNWDFIVILNNLKNNKVSSIDKALIEMLKCVILKVKGNLFEEKQHNSTTKIIRKVQNKWNKL